jgi:integrase
MTANPRRQLPPQIKKASIVDRPTGKTVVRYQVTVDTGVNQHTARRQQARRRYATEKAARAALAEIADATVKGQFVARSSTTVEEVCFSYIFGRHKLRDSSRAKLACDLGPLRQRHGSMSLQRLTKAHIDKLVSDLLAGGTQAERVRLRRPWSAVAVNKVISTIDQLLADAMVSEVESDA